jgi:mannose-6-phosphate isomerase
MLKPFILEPNIMERPYRGGYKIAEFRNIPDLGDYHPEDWVGSTTHMYTDEKLGMTYLKNGLSLRDAISTNPQEFLGPERVKQFGNDPGLLVKLLDAGERLSVQCHPNREFAQENLGVPYGKAEAWIILETYVEKPAVYLGFKDDIDLDKLEEFVKAQDRSKLRNLLNQLDVSPGDSVFIPGGVPHAIGEGVFLAEVQEPSDLLLRLEWKGYKVGTFSSDMGLGLRKALECVDRDAYGAKRLSNLWRRNSDQGSRRENQIENLLPPEANSFFRAERIQTKSEVSINQEYSIIIVTKGSGKLQTKEGEMLDLRHGMTVLIPWIAGVTKLHGDIEIIRCLPPILKNSTSS